MGLGLYLILRFSCMHQWYTVLPTWPHFFTSDVVKVKEEIVLQNGHSMAFSVYFENARQFSLPWEAGKGGKSCIGDSTF